MSYKALDAAALPMAILALVEKAHAEQKKLVLVTGVFDLIHSEHILFLTKAKAEGDVLLVALESDVRVREIKGPDRPVTPENLRVQNLEKLQLADGVFILPDTFGKPEHHRQLIHAIKPAVLAVSSHTAHLENKRQILAEVGGEVRIVHQHNPAISTTKILENQTQPT